MKKILVLPLIIMGFVSVADAAVSSQRETSQTTVTRGTNTAANTRSTTTAARSATTTARAATPAATTTRSATTGRTTVARSSATTSADTPTVSARAATTKGVIGTGTKIAKAAKNVIVSEECQQKYEGCMDAFCMIDNDSGGRCICSDRNAELDEVLAQIELLDQQSYQMATYGVERIEMGADADQVLANANAVANSILNEVEEEDKKTIDLSLWNTPITFEDEDIFASEDIFANSVEGKEGDALYSAADSICAAQIPECSAEISMLQLMYSQKIKSDCTAYENSLKQQKNASANKLAVAEKALRDAALEQFRTANKYDLGQCTLQFKNCMMTTGGCGEDFSGCATISAFDNTNSAQSDKDVATYTISGSATSIEIYASTYDALLSKKPLCDNITNSCVAVKDQVWDTFLKEVAPQIKSAELIAEDNVRQNCVSSISECFQNACKETMDPNDPDGSYDLCLTRPESMLNLCKIPLNACGIDSSSEEAAMESSIWDYVVARLASMRVDSCTTQVKECLQSEDRCGSDYSQCIGLDTESILELCPIEKLTGCVIEYGEEELQSEESSAYAQLEVLIQGIILNIDNSMLTQCQQALDTAMISVCGDTENCNSLVLDEGLGGGSLEYKLCEYDSSAKINYNNCRTNISQISDSELGRISGGTENDLGAITNFAGVIDGIIPWETVSFDEDGNLQLTNTKNDDLEVVSLATESNLSTAKDYISKAVQTLQLSTEKQDQVVSELALLQKNIASAIQTIESDPTVQFCMTGRQVQGVRTVIGTNVGRFPELTNQVRLQIAISAFNKARKNYNDRYEELVEQQALDNVELAERMAEIRGENALEARRESARISCLGVSDGSSLSDEAASNSGGDYVSSNVNEDWNYKETVTSTFNSETLICHRCVRSQSCADPKGGRKMCKKWNEPVETCTDIQF